MAGWLACAFLPAAAADGDAGADGAGMMCSSEEVGEVERLAMSCLSFLSVSCGNCDGDCDRGCFVRR